MALDPKIRINLDRSVVLLVDDNSQALEALTAMFWGFGVRKQFKSRSGSEAMHVVKTQELDLIVIDSSMPEMIRRPATENITTAANVSQPGRFRPVMTSDIASLL